MDYEVEVVKYYHLIHARWIRIGYEPYHCSNCGRRLNQNSDRENYCPQCGAIMDLKERRCSNVL